MRLAPFALLVAGCFSKPGEPSLTGDGHGSVDAPPLCTDAFDMPVVVPGLASANAADPALSENRLVAYLAVQAIANTGPYHIRRGSRTAPDEPFTVVLTDLDWGDGSGTTSESDPAPNADGSAVMFIRENQNGGKFGFIAMNTAAAPASPPASPWTVSAIPGLVGQQMRSLDVSSDFKTLYFNDESDVLHIADLVNSAYVDRGMSFGTNLVFPTVTANGLELFYNGNMGINRATRSSLDAPFVGDPTDAPVFPSASRYVSDPDVSPDGRKLIMQVGDDIAEATRACQ